MTGLTTLRIDVENLVDAYVTITESEYGWEDPTYPDLYRLDVNGEAWLTDRHWLLPESVCRVGKHFEITDLAADSSAAASSAQWISDLAAADLTETARRFAVPFAGELTKAGLSARGGLSGRDMCALVDSEGTRVGILMPVRESPDGPPSVSLPVPVVVVEMFERINEAGVVRRWQAWALAAILTGEATS